MVWLAWPALSFVLGLALVRSWLFRVKGRVVQKSVDAGDWRTLSAHMATDGTQPLGAHMLDVTPELMRATAEAPADSSLHVRLVPISAYLKSLAWDVPEITVYHFACTWAHERLRTRWLAAVLLGLMPSSTPVLRIVLFANDGVDALRAFDSLAGVPSLNWLTGMAEFAHYLRSKLPSPLSNLFAIAHSSKDAFGGADARAAYPVLRPTANGAAIYAVGTEARNRKAGDMIAEPWVPSTNDAVLAQFGDPGLPNTASAQNIQNEARLRATRMGVDPCRKVYQTPMPVLDEMFPGLCLGAGGITPLQTPLKQASNALVADVLNRLASNTLVDVGLAPEPFASRGFFTLLLNCGRRVATLRDFAERVPGIRIFFSRTTSPFDLFLCLRDGGAAPAIAETSTDPDSRSAYAQIPVAWPARVALRDPVTGRQHAIIAFHDALVIEGDAVECPLGEFRVQYHLGPEGCTCWRPGDEMVRPWAPLEEHQIARERWARALSLAGLAACASNWSASRVHGFEFGGYGVHGTCTDSTALLQACVNGSLETFPLYATGDSKAGFAYACRRVLACKLLEVEDTEPGRAARCKQAARELDELAAMALSLPNDADIRPADLAASVDRMLKTTPGEFVCAKRAQAELRRLKRDWEEVFTLKAEATGPQLAGGMLASD